MNGAVAILAELRARGVELVPAGDRIRFRPASAVPPELKERLREHKAEVMAILTAPVNLLPAVRSWIYPWPAAILGLGPHHIGPFELCSSCSAWSWSQYGETVLCFRCAIARARA